MLHGSKSLLLVVSLLLASTPMMAGSSNDTCLSVRESADAIVTTNERHDWYVVLGLPPRGSPELAKATAIDVRKARVARLRDMRRFGEGDPALLNRAVEIICEPHSRATYDRCGHADMSEVRPGLFLGAESGARRPALLVHLTHVLAASHSLEYLHKPLRAAGIH